MINSASDVEQGCNQGLLWYRARYLEFLPAFPETTPIVDAKLMKCIRNMVVLLPSDHAESADVLSKMDICHQQRLESRGVDLNRVTSEVLLPPDADIDSWSEGHKATLRKKQLRVTKNGVMVVSVPIGPLDHIRDRVRHNQRALLNCFGV